MSATALDDLHTIDSSRSSGYNVSIDDGQRWLGRYTRSTATGRPPTSLNWPRKHPVVERVEVNTPNFDAQALS